MLQHTTATKKKNKQKQKYSPPHEKKTTAKGTNEENGE